MPRASCSAPHSASTRLPGGYTIAHRSDLQPSPNSARQSISPRCTDHSALRRPCPPTTWRMTNRDQIPATASPTSWAGVRSRMTRPSLRCSRCVATRLRARQLEWRIWTDGRSDPVGVLCGAVGSVAVILCRSITGDTVRLDLPPPAEPTHPAHCDRHTNPNAGPAAPEAAAEAAPGPSQRTVRSVKSQIVAVGSAR